VFEPVDRNSDVPVGTQLLAQLRAAVADGELGPGDLFPSIRDLAEATGVSVNTVRSAYARLENEGLARSEHGRGTFVADERGTRRELRRQIERLEAAVARRPQRGTTAGGAPAGRLLSTDELREVRDSLRAEVGRLDDERAELMRRLRELDRLDAEAEPTEDKRTSTSLGNVRLRWVGG
jgi:GntR family transcriptional regulator